MIKTMIKRFLNSLLKHEGYVQDYRSKVRLPFYLESVLIGLMLSDGFLERSSPTSTVRLSVNFSIKHAPYLMHLFVLFEPYIETGPDVISTFNSKTKTYNIIIKFKTVSLPLFMFYHKLFYKSNPEEKYVKFIPQNIEQYINPVVLAHLIMGDGNLKSKDDIIRIYTNSFTKEEVELLALAISKKLRILTKVVHDRKDQYIIVISKDQLIKVRELLIPYMHPSMYYKLGLENSNFKFNYKNIIDYV